MFAELRADPQSVMSSELLFIRNANNI